MRPLASLANVPRRIAEAIEASLNLRLFLPVLAAALAATWYGLGWSLQHFAALTGGRRFIDMQPTLTADALFAQIREYSPETVDFYLWWLLFDYAWPFLGFTAMLLITAWLLRFLSSAWQTRFWVLVASAYLTVLMDWGENLGFASLVVGLPAEPLWLARLTLALHVAKLFFNMVFNLGFWLILLAAIITRVRAWFAGLPTTASRTRKPG
jgi:hypothetical protein